MNLDEFEERLQRQPIRSLPPEWKTDILHAARQATPGVATFAVRFPSRSWWRTFFWPHPTAWAALAMIWLMIGTLHLTLDRTETNAAHPPSQDPVTPALRMALAQQRQLRRELLHGTQDALAPDSPSQGEPSRQERPRSSRRLDSSTV